MASLEEIRAIRLEKLERLKKAGVDPYPIETKRDHTLSHVVEKFEALSKDATKKYTLAGRVMALRPQGALAFFVMNDGTGKFQGLIKNEGDVASAFALFIDTVDVGDFVEATGTLFVTKRGEKTLEVTSWRMLSKSLRPLPEKWHGLQDVEERFRRRYLDALMSEDVKMRFFKRSKIITQIRSFLDTHDFVEFETPALQPLAGGTNATPFVTHHKALDIDLFLRIAPELYLKKLLIAGFPKVYEIGRNFRNEGIDATHNPEFTMLEYYQSYSCASEQMAFTETLLKTVVKKIMGTTEIVFDTTTIDFSKDFEVISYANLLSKYAQISGVEKMTLEDARLRATQLGVKYDKGDGIEKIVDIIYKKTCRPRLIQPTCVTEYPLNMLPLAKRTHTDSSFVNAFQIIIGGMEIVKAFSELNDPIDQKERFSVQEKNMKAGDAEAQPNDEEYVEALEYGMPPAGGVGIGIDRLVMLLTDTKNIKEVIFFPTLRPRDQEK